MQADKIFKFGTIIADYEIRCYSRSNKQGFTHRATLFMGEEQIAEAKTQYLNRTWERFEFESVIGKLLHKVKNTDKNIQEILDNLATNNSKELDQTFGRIATIAKLGEVFGETPKEKNDWKVRMLKAGLDNMGLIMPEDWENLDEETKQVRLDAVINHLGKDSNVQTR